MNSWADDGLRLTPDGYLAEDCWSNIVIEKKGVILHASCLSGPLGRGNKKMFFG